jgi:hypothetical protein
MCAENRLMTGMLRKRTKVMALASVAMGHCTKSLRDSPLKRGAYLRAR